MANPKNTYTLEDFIEVGSSIILSYNNLSMTEKFYNINFPMYNVLNDYIEELKTISITVTLSDAEYNRYLYKPKLLAHDLYGNPELHFVIMALNGICNIKEFDLKNIKLIKKDDIKEALGYIYNSERNDIAIYNNREIEER